MSTRRTESEALAREAGEWFERVHGEPALDDFIAWQEWLDADASRAHAFRRLEHAWNLTAVGATWPSAERLQRDKYEHEVSLLAWQRARDRFLSNTSDVAEAPLRWRVVWPSVIAASLASFAVAVGLFVVRYSPQHSSLPSSALVKTDAAEVREYSLTDGSRVTVGARTRVSVNFVPDARNIVIEYGEAFFDVADDRRPFIVHAANGTITATGTAFNVLRLQGRVVVTVVEGSVNVVQVPNGNPQPTPALAAKPAVPARAVILHVRAGEVATYDTKVTAIKPADTSSATSWRRGMLKYLREPLKFVVPDVARYTHLDLEIGDAEVGEMVYIGTVLPDEIEDWLISLTYAFPIDIEREGDHVILLARKQAPE